MKILPDTQIVLWALADSTRLPEAARKIIMDEDNHILFSAASV